MLILRLSSFVILQGYVFSWKSESPKQMYEANPASLSFKWIFGDFDSWLQINRDAKFVQTACYAGQQFSLMDEYRQGFRI